MNFRKSNAVGKQGEKAVCDLIKAAGFRWSESANGDLSKWDLSVCFDGDTPLLIEVKFDAKSNVTGNLAVEVWNSRKDTPSGLSATHSHLWVFVLSSALIYAIRTVELKLLVNQVEPWKIIEKGGDDNASLYLFPKQKILPLCRRLDCMNKDEFRVYLEHEKRCLTFLPSTLSLQLPGMTTSEEPASTSSRPEENFPVPW